VHSPKTSLELRFAFFRGSLLNGSGDSVPGIANYGIDMAVSLQDAIHDIADAFIIIDIHDYRDQPGQGLAIIRHCSTPGSGIDFHSGFRKHFCRFRPYSGTAACQKDDFDSGFHDKTIISIDIPPWL
jgi:hypothetical protein